MKNTNLDYIAEQLTIDGQIGEGLEGEELSYLTNIVNQILVNEAEQNREKVHEIFWHKN